MDTDNLGFAKLDLQRLQRRGFGETVYCAGKTAEQVATIFERFAANGQNVLGTRATPEQAKACPRALYDPLSRVLAQTLKPSVPCGGIVVCSGGTSDAPVAEEAARTAEFLGARVVRLYDVGVAGLHRLLEQTEVLRKANAIVAVAGMEGALGSVVAGLVEVPVFAVPTSVGYGASFQGLAPLLSMLNSCAEGLSVVNIDNGFGAGYLAAQVNRLIVRAALPHES
ncbi:MAG: nickel pincer cofactor biosynthesis protein LarB [Kiritimatiellia bacterium]